MNLDHGFFLVSKLSETKETKKKRSSPKLEHGTLFSPNSDQKKRSSPEMERFFSPNSSRYAHQSQIIGGDADKDHTQIIGGNTVKLLGGIYPPGFRHPWMYVPPESPSRRRWF